jgi:hypothetical protein
MDPNIRLRRSVCNEKKKHKCNGTDAERWKYKKDEKLISKWSKNQTNKHLRFSNNKVFIGRITTGNRANNIPKQTGRQYTNK